MRKLLILWLLFLPIFSYGEEGTIYSQTVFGGLQTDKTKDDIGLTNTPDCQNVYLDEYIGAITKRTGSVKDNTTALGGNLWIRELYTYKRYDGTHYLLANSSTSIFSSSGDSNYSTLLGGQNATNTFDFTTAKDYVYGANGVNIFKSSGTTTTILGVTNSTGVPTTAKYIKYANNRMFYAGMATSPSVVWWSEINDPDNVQTYNYINVNVSDGDSITGIFPYQGKIIITKERSTWQLTEFAVGSFSISPISLNIGCLYQSTMQTWLNFPVWMSHRGIELYDGQFNLISQPIDPSIKALSQIDKSVNQVSVNSATEWSEGSGTNIDTTTYSGSVAIKKTFISNTTDTYAHSSGSDFSSAYQTRARIQAIVATENITLNYIEVVSSLSANAYIDMTIYSSTYTSFSNGILVSTRCYYGSNPILNNISISLLSGASVYVYLNGYSSGSGTVNIGTSTYNSSGQPYWQEGTNGVLGTFTERSGVYASMIVNKITDGSYTTKDITAGTSWGTWGTFSVDQVVPTSSSISYYAITSTSAYNITTNTAFALTNGAVVNSAVGPYIKIVSSFSRTDTTAIPMINKISISYTGTTNMIPKSIVWKDRYYLSVMEDSNGGVNDTVYVYDKNGQWTKHTGNIGGMTEYRGQLYVGSSSSGQIYKREVDNVYSDDGVAIDAYYTTKAYDFREQDIANTLREKSLLELWARFEKETTGTLDMDYRLDGDDDGYTTLHSVDLNDTYGLPIVKMNFTDFPKSRFVQFRFRQNSASDEFVFKGFYLPFILEERR